MPKKEELHQIEVDGEPRFVDDKGNIYKETGPAIEEILVTPVVPIPPGPEPILTKVGEIKKEE